MIVGRHVVKNRYTNTQIPFIKNYGYFVSPDIYRVKGILVDMHDVVLIAT